MKSADSSRSGFMEQSNEGQRKLVALEEELKQKVGTAFPHCQPNHPTHLSLPFLLQNEQLNTMKGSLETTRSTLSAMSAKSNALREEKKELNGLIVSFWGRRKCRRC